MQKELKRLFMGFIYSLMTISFILGPIPLTSYDAQAQRERRKVYKKGENVDEIVQTTEMKNYTDDAEGFKAIIHQGVAGVMSMTLLESLRWKYLYDLKPDKYGNDCSKNTAAKYTMRVSQFGGLLYLIGDVSANMQFQKAAKKAADEMEEGKMLDNFDPQAKVDHKNMSDEEKEAWEEENGGAIENEESRQVAAFSKLIEILEGQEQALKTKKALNTMSALAFTASTGIEVAKMIQCGVKCATDRTKKTTIKIAETVINFRKNLFCFLVKFFLCFPITLIVYSFYA